MLKSALLLAPVCTVFLSRPLEAAPSKNSAESAREYEQVRKIAMRDPKVQAGFARANERLEAKIAEIDPTLSQSIKRKGAVGSPEALASRPSALRAGKKSPSRMRTKSTTAPTHVVAAGETLGKIAQRYGTTADELRRVNHIKDERKLTVGKVLMIPSTTSAARSARKASVGTTSPRQEEKKSWWNRF